MWGKSTKYIITFSLEENVKSENKHAADDHVKNQNTCKQLFRDNENLHEY